MVVDTDVVIRYLTKDDLKKSDRFKKFLQSGKKIILTDVTVAEIYWTLSSFYGFPKMRVLQGIESLINFSSIQSSGNLIHKTIEILKSQNISYIDAYTAAYSIIFNDHQVLSFDQGFDKISSITRKEPGTN